MADPDSRAGSRYAKPELLAFLEGVHVADTGVFAAAFEAPEAHGMPAIQVGPSEAKALGLLLRLCGAKRVVEIGTLAGYSTLHMARALPADGRLWSLEIDPKHAAIARRHIEQAGFADRVEIRVGPALSLLDTLAEEGPFDAVFLDADKENYAAYGAWAQEHLRPGGLLLADNAYFFGRLLDDTQGARSVRQLHEQSALAFDTVCLPTPDGMLIGIRR